MYRNGMSCMLHIWMRVVAFRGLRHCIAEGQHLHPLGPPALVVAPVSPLVHTDVCINDLEIGATNPKGGRLHLASDGVSTLSARPCTNLTTTIFWILSVGASIHNTTLYTGCVDSACTSQWSYCNAIAPDGSPCGSNPSVARCVPGDRALPRTGCRRWSPVDVSCVGNTICESRSTTRMHTPIEGVKWETNYR